MITTGSQKHRTLSGLTSISFDLDGTLLDTLEDLTLACNRMMHSLGFDSPFNQQTIAGFIGEGMRSLVSQCLAAKDSGHDPFLINSAIEAFRKSYAQINGQCSKLYPNTLETLDFLRQQGIGLACVTNKPTEFTLPLLKVTGLAHYFNVVVCGDSLKERKPSPAPILFAISQLCSRPETHAHVGDSIHDAHAAKTAGCQAIGVSCGYDKNLKAVDCDLFLEDAYELTHFLTPNHRPLSQVNLPSTHRDPND